MSLDSLAHRPRYQRSGKVRWGRFFAVLPIPMATAAAMAAALCWMLVAGRYYPLMSPCLVSLPIVGAMCLLVRWSHCRNVAFATLLGIVLGTVMYLGYFHAHLIALQGPAAIHRVDRLPRFIHWRMKTDLEVNPEQPQPQRQQQPDVGYNWFRFGFEWIAVVALVGGLSAAWASRGYCEACGSWMRQGMHVAPLGSAQQIAAHLAAGRLPELPKIEQVTPTSGASSSVKVEACRHVGQNGECQAYLTLHDTIAGGFLKGNKTTKYLSAGLITQEELGWLSLKLAGLTPLAPPGFAAAAAQITSEADEASLIALPAIAPGDLATIETLSPDAGERVFTKMNTAIAACLSLFPLVSLAGGVGLLVAAWWFWPANLADTPRVVLGLVSLVTGGLAALFGLVVTFVNVDYFNMQYCQALARHEIAVRPGAIVDPRDTRAVFVEVVPRERWTDILGDKPTDGGFLLVDESRRQLLFEGVKQRYRVPAEAMLHCQAEPTQPHSGRFSMYAAVVQAQVAATESGAATGVWEAPFMVRPMTFTRFSGAYRRRSCEELAEQIRQIKA